MQKPTQKFRQNYVVFEKPGIMSGKLQTLASLKYHSLIIFVEYLHNFPT